MVKVSEIEELIGLLNGLMLAIRTYEAVKEGKYKVISPIGGREIEVDVPKEEIERALNDLNNALKAAADKIKSIDWSRVE